MNGHLKNYAKREIFLLNLIQKSAKGYYRVKGPDYALLDIGLFIRSLEKLPIAIVE